ncbi:methylated-DNA--[protein]-cysteine S-methyltransferase [Maribrevibacterium harenarium]|uniref:Methylated-DNA--[protein]-cysteine S-methyltransferase n=1 Tax=Maribrevibacterium harenarium TaxID=2589817 RepID=A0A501WD83_9GAMM|nr:methylated-DNA--[protein]-cysteine S-methyltransferase [Maribrevibacterium harenarium]TPE46792.1 methylated-DNA--[protein]-cysteine S-methyltransferase [Maribrevibacterium harenarium]
MSKHHHYQLVADAIAYLTEHVNEQPPLSALAKHLGLSDAHLQKVFSEWVGISPKRFMQVLTKEAALAALREQHNTLDAAASAGLSGTGRLYDLLLTCEAMTPGEIQSGGAGLVIEFGFTATPFGEALLAWSQRGLCFLQFTDDRGDETLKFCRSQWPNGTFRENPAQARTYGEQIFSTPLRRGKLHLLLKGTNFQVKVWQAMINTSPERLYSYGQIAQLIGQPNASRAVGTALAQNTIGYLIPCHRVIQASGNVGQYRWGPTRKQAIQAWELAQSKSDQD